MFEKFKLAAQAMSPADIKRGIELSKQSIANGGRLTEEQMAGWTPEQRAQWAGSDGRRTNATCCRHRSRTGSRSVSRSTSAPA